MRAPQARAGGAGAIGYRGAQKARPARGRRAAGSRPPRGAYAALSQYLQRSFPRMVGFEQLREAYQPPSTRRSTMISATKAPSIGAYTPAQNPRRPVPR